jgi:uncharacterized protein YjlB
LRQLNVKDGDVVVLPAGTGHRLIESSRKFWWLAHVPSKTLTMNARIRATDWMPQSASRKCASPPRIPCMGRTDRWSKHGAAAESAPDRIQGDGDRCAR